MEIDKFAEYQVVIRNGQAMGIESLVKTGLMSYADAAAQLELLIKEGSPAAEEVLIRLGQRQASPAAAK